MKRIHHFLFFAVIVLAAAGCSSSGTPQPSAELTKQFSGGPMPPDAQKKFQESMKKTHDLMKQQTPNGAPPVGH